MKKNFSPLYFGFSIDTSSEEVPFYLAVLVQKGKTLREWYASNEDTERFQTTHHQRDTETTLDYRGARFYDADVGRFLSLDPLAADYPRWSNYNYVLGDPILLKDPDGRGPTLGTAVAGGVIGLGLGVTASIVIQVASGNEIDWNKVTRDGLSGGVSGAIIGSGAGIIQTLGGLTNSGSLGGYVLVGSGMLSGAAGETTSQGVEMVQGEREVGDFEGKPIMNSTLEGGVINVLSAGTGQALKKPVENLANKFSPLRNASNQTIKNSQRPTIKTAQNEVKKGQKTKADLKQGRKDAKQDAINSVREKESKKAVSRTVLGTQVLGGVAGHTLRNVSPVD